MTYKTIDDMFKQFPWMTQSRFFPLEKRYGFTEEAVLNYLKKVVHDVTVPKAKYKNIYLKHSGSYQMDTFKNDKNKDGLNYSMLININTRKTYSYPMNGKGAKEVVKALNSFFEEEPDVYSISLVILSFFQENN